MTFDAMSNSPSHSQREYKEIWKENLAFIRSHLRLFSRHSNSAVCSSSVQRFDGISG